MRYKNANIFVDDRFILGSFTVENGIFTEISEDTTGAGEPVARHFSSNTASTDGAAR